jgi:hypothetical protein
MKVQTLNAYYNLYEFHHYIDNIDDDDLVNIVELIIESDDMSSIETDFSNTFAIETTNQSYIFSHYEVSEYYAVGENSIKVICIK